MSYRKTLAEKYSKHLAWTNSPEVTEKSSVTARRNALMPRFSETDYANGMWIKRKRSALRVQEGEEIAQADTWLRPVSVWSVTLSPEIKLYLSAWSLIIWPLHLLLRRESRPSLGNGEEAAAVTPMSTDTSKLLPWPSIICVYCKQ